MELYGSLLNISGSVTASAFSGSFNGDGGGLYNLPASGVTGLNLSQIASGDATASISSSGFTVNKSTQIQGDLSVTGSIIATNYIVSSSVTYMTTSFASGSSMFGNDGNDIHQFTGSVQITGSISLNGQAIGTGKLDETTFQSYTSSISSSIGTLSSSIALTDVSQSNRLTTIEGNYATTGSNLFKGSQTISGSIIPSVDNLYDLGSSTYQWRDVYISSGSLYIDGTKVLGSTSQELTITTDTGQSLKILEAGSDSIILQSADGDIELKSSGGGDILFDPTNGIISIKGTTQIQDGFKITSSGGTNIVFGDTIIVSGSIDLTGNVDGIDLQSFSSSVSASISSLLGGNTSLSTSIATTTSGLSSSIGSLSSSVATTTSGLTSTITSVSSSLTSSIGSLSSSLAITTSGLSSSIGSLSSSVATTTLGTKNRVDSIETTTSSLNTFTSSASGILTSLETASGSIRTDFNTYTGSNNTTNTTQDGRLTSIEGITGSISLLNTYTGSNNTVIGTLQTSTSSLNSYTSSNTTNIDAIHISTGSFKSFTSSFDTAFGMSGADVTVKGNLTVSGTQTTVNSTTVAIGDNIIQLNGTGATNAGLVVRDATAPNTVSGSFLWDSTSDKWIAGALGSEDDVVLKTATQTLTNKTINASQLVDASVTNTKLANSSITIAGTSTSLGGTISAATILSGTGTVSGSAQIDLTATTNYASGILTRLNAVGVFSGSAQVTGIGNAQLTNSSVTVTAGTGMSGGGAVSLGGTVTLTNAGVTSITTNTGLSSNVSATGAVTITNTITNNNQLTNGAGYITGINSSAVTTALGYTPYNATNPSGYISSITSGNVTTALGFTPYNATNPSGYITGISFANVSAKPTTISGYGITDAITTANIGSQSVSSATSATFATNSSKLYSTDVAYSYTSGAPYYGYLTYDGTYWLYQVSPATPSAVRVARADAAGNATTAGGFTPSQTSGTANRIVVADGNGYIINNYFNASGGGSERNASGMGYFAGHNTSDYYYRSYTAAAAAALLSGQSMNISGTATNITAYTINQSVGTANAPTFAGGTINGSLYVNANNDITTLAGSLTLYSTGNGTTSMIMFKNTTGLGYGNHGAIAGTYNTYFVMDTTDRGWIFRNATTSANIASISNTGVIAANSHLYTGGYILRTAAGQGWLSGNYASSENGSSSHVIYSIGGSYVPTATTLGNMYGIGFANAAGSGYALQMTSASGWGLYIASNGTPYAFIGSEGNASVFRSTILPHANNTYNLGSASYRWANLYTNDLHLSNDGKEGGNEIDGTTGDWTIQEGQENLYIINNKNGKKFKIDLTEIE